MTAPSTSIWTAKPELDAAAKDLWRNHSASQIAAKLSAEFNILISRNAVIGRLSRTGYNIAQKTEVHFNVRSDRTTRIPVTRAPRAPRPSKPRQRPVVCEALPSRQLSLDQLGPDECRFIAGDDHLYCGHPTETGRSFCAAHHALCRRKPEERRVTA